MARIARPLKRLLERSRRCECGTTAAEFGLVIMPLLWLLFGALQLSIVYAAQSLLETAAESAGRKIATGQVQTASLSAAQFKATLCPLLTPLFSCNNVMVDIRTVSSISASDAASPSLTFGQNGQVTNAWLYQPGSPGQMVVLRLLYQWPIVVIPGLDLSNLQNGMRLLIATNVIRTENYQ